MRCGMTDSKPVMNTCCSAQNNLGVLSDTISLKVDRKQLGEVRDNAELRSNAGVVLYRAKQQ